MYDPRDPYRPYDSHRQMEAPYGRDTDGNEMARSMLVIGIIVAAILAGLWLAGA
jgi:hypothetical protein